MTVWVTLTAFIFLLLRRIHLIHTPQFQWTLNNWLLTFNIFPLFFLLHLLYRVWWALRVFAVSKDLLVMKLNFIYSFYDVGFTSLSQLLTVISMLLFHILNLVLELSCFLLVNLTLRVCQHILLIKFTELAFLILKLGF